MWIKRAWREIKRQTKGISVPEDNGEFSQRLILDKVGKIKC